MFSKFVDDVIFYREKVESKFLNNQDEREKKFWRNKDVIWHILWYEKETLSVLQHRKLVGSDDWDMPLKERNDKIHEEGKDKLWVELVVQWKDVFTSLIEELKELDESHFNENKGFEFPPDFNLKDILNGNLLRHYKDHLGLIKKSD